jgi:hypothetical protein
VQWVKSASVKAAPWVTFWDSGKTPGMPKLPGLDLAPDKRQGVLTFTRREESPYFQAECQRIFKPKGLLLWDVGRASLQMLTIGTNSQLICSFGPLPARWFTTADSFDAVAKAVASGKQPAAWGSWDIVQPGVLVRLHFDEPVPLAQAVMWGEYV